MTTAPTFSVIIPVFNKWDLTAACLRSLREHTLEYDYEVIVVDNASSDATATELQPLGQSLFGARFCAIRFAENRNFGPACNAGAVAASAPLLFFLNNDTLLNPGWSPPLVAALAADPKLGGVGPLLLYENNAIQHLGVCFEPQSVNHLYRGFPSEHPVASRRRHFQAITAAALLMPTGIFRKHNGFHEGYRNGFEDVDLCLRIRATGKYFSCIPESVVYHLESQTIGRMESEADNAGLLFERCGHLFRPDKHLIGLDDGFAPFINDWFGIGLCMTAEAEAALCCEAAGQPFSRWYALSRAHPLWTAGREVLVQMLEREGRCNDTVFFLAEIAHIKMHIDRYDRLIQAATQAGNAEVLALAEATYASLVAANSNRARPRKFLRQAVERRDRVLAALYEQALRESPA